MAQSGYQAFAQHTESYTIGGVVYKVTADFVQERISVISPVSVDTCPMDDYTHFVGDMKEFVIDWLNL